MDWILMEGKGVYVWGSYGVGFLLLGLLAYDSWRRRDSARRRKDGESRGDG